MKKENMISPLPPLLFPQPSLLLPHLCILEQQHGKMFSLLFLFIYLFVLGLLSYQFQCCRKSQLLDILMNYVKYQVFGKEAEDRHLDMCSWKVFSPAQGQLIHHSLMCCLIYHSCLIDLAYEFFFFFFKMLFLKGRVILGYIITLKM